MRIGSAACLILSIVAFSGATAATKPARLPTMSNLATVWVGGMPETDVYLRLELTELGTGLLTMRGIPDNPATAYKVTRTTLAKYRVTFELTPAEPDAEPIYLRGTAIPGRLDLALGGVTGDWKRSVVLEPLSVLLERIEVVTRRAHEVGERKE